MMLMAGTGDLTNGAPTATMACAPRSLSVAAQLVGRGAARADLERAFDGRLDGRHSFGEIANAAARLGLAVQHVRLDGDCQLLARLPLIAAVRESYASRRPDHFVVIFGRRDGELQLLDSPRPPRFIPIEEFLQQWDGDGLYIAASAQDLARLPGTAQSEKSFVLFACATVIGASGLLFWKSPTRKSVNLKLPILISPSAGKRMSCAD